MHRRSARESRTAVRPASRRVQNPMAETPVQSRRRKLILTLSAALVAIAFAMRQLIRHGGIYSLQAGVEAVEPYVHEFPVFGTYGRLTFWAPEEFARTAAATISLGRPRTTRSKTARKPRNTAPPRKGLYSSGPRHGRRPRGCGNR